MHALVTLNVIDRNHLSGDEHKKCGFFLKSGNFFQGKEIYFQEMYFLLVLESALNKQSSMQV